jgi:hydroxymethylpyrimidine/phosphomethylpyrimidine kinase
MKTDVQKRARAVPPVALTVAGFDPSSGAGITADLKVFAAHGVFGVSAITALTVQSTQGVRGIEPVSGRLLGESLACLRDDMEIAGVKIGMLGSSEAVEAMAGFLSGAGIPRERVVLDPVLRSSSGRALLEDDGVALLREKLLPLVGWVTPNLAELMVLTGQSEPETREAVPAVARELARMAAGGGNPELNVVVTGGHLERPDDFLRTAAGDERWFSGERVETTATHGTGCAFSSALLCRLLLGDSGMEAVGAAKRYVREAMLAAYPVGKGRGPMHHLYAFDSERGGSR